MLTSALAYSTVLLFCCGVNCGREVIIQQQRPRNLITHCAHQSHASKGDVAIFKKKEIPTSEQGKCMLACVFSRKGVMTKGKFNSKNSIKVAHQAYPNDADKIDKVIEILDSCGTKVNSESNKCELAYKLAHCTTVLSEKIKLL